MVADAYVNHIPVLTGGVGRKELREFYSKRFIPQIPPDTEMTPISRTIGNDQLVDEMVTCGGSSSVARTTNFGVHAGSGLRDDLICSVRRFRSPTQPQIPIPISPPVDAAGHSG
jgi:hypothetical protein